MARKLPQFFLADLVAIVTICGLVLGLFQSSGSAAVIAVVFALIGLVGIVWLTFRGLRNSPTCDECGRRFLMQVQKNTPPPLCPQCRQAQLRPARLRKALAISFWVIMALIALCTAVMSSIELAEFSTSSKIIISLYI
jgi:hypothetical protein